MNKYLASLAVSLLIVAASHAQSTAEALKFLVPAADQVTGSFRVEDKSDGQGDKVTFWDTGKLGAMPDKAAIEQAKIDLVAARQAAATLLANERAALIALRDKVQSGQDLTPAELRTVIRLLIRRSLLSD